MKSFYKTTIIALLIIADIFILTKTFTMAEVYPFDRIIIKGKLYQSLVILKKSPYFQSEIIAINNQELKSAAVIKALLKTKDLKTITLKISNNREHMILADKSFNYDLFAFIFFLVFFGNIHALWGLFLSTFGKKNVVSKQFSLFLILYGILLLITITSLLLEFSYSFLTIFCSAAIFDIITSTAIYLSNLKEKRKIQILLHFFTFLSAIFACIVGQMTSIKLYLSISSFMVISSILIFVVSLLKRLFTKKTNRNFSSFYLIIGAIGLILPLAGFAVSLYIDFVIPVTFLTAFSVFAPILIGNNILNDYILTGNQKKKYHSKMITDFLFTSIFSFTLYLTLTKNHSLSKPFIIIILTFFLIALLLLRQVVLFYLKKSSIETRDKFITSIQLMSEIATQPINMTERLSRIYYEIYNTLGISKFKLFTFKNDEFSSDIKQYEDYIQSLTFESILYRTLNTNKQIIISNYIFTENYYKTLIISKEIPKETDVIIPLYETDKLNGALCCSEKLNKASFLSDEITYLISCGKLIIQMLENEILFKNYMVKGKYEHELDIASYVQLRLFPKEVPLNKGFNLSFFSRPFIKVTGDYFDFIEIDENKTCIIIGDVAGHGLPAAMIMSITASIFQALLQEKKSLSEIFIELNDFFINRYSGMELITLFSGIFDKENKTFEYVNAGHCEPIIINKENNTIKKIQNKNHIIGVLDDPDYSPEKIDLSPKEELIFYTDGLTEIQDPITKGDIGEKIIYDVITKNKEKNIEEKIEYVTDYIDSIGINNIKDDITIIGMEIL